MFLPTFGRSPQPWIFVSQNTCASLKSVTCLLHPSQISVGHWFQQTPFPPHLFTWRHEHMFILSTPGLQPSFSWSVEAPIFWINGFCELPGLTFAILLLPPESIIVKTLRLLPFCSSFLLPPLVMGMKEKGICFQQCWELDIYRLIKSLATPFIHIFTNRETGARWWLTYR